MIADAAIESDVFLVTEGNYRLDKKLYVSIHESISVSSTKEVLTLELDVKKAGYLSEMIGLANDKFSNETIKIPKIFPSQRATSFPKATLERSLSLKNFQPKVSLNWQPVSEVSIFLHWENQAKKFMSAFFKQ